MASTEILTSTESRVINQARSLAKAGNRLYWAGGDGTNLVYKYSDDDGATWTGTTTISSNEFLVASLVYDAVNGRLNIVYAGGNESLRPLAFRAITSNVTSGSPGALTTETVIDAGGANAGIAYPEIIHSATGSNPRYWILGQKWTGAGPNIETRAWFANAGTDADTAGNWSTTNFTDLGANSDGFGRHMGHAVWWTVGGAEKVTFIFNHTSGIYEAVTFDPTAAAPTPGSVTSVITGIGSADWSGNSGSPSCLVAKADYLVFGTMDVDDFMWDFHKTVNGTDWSSPAAWANLTMGRAALTKSGSDFYAIYTDVTGAVAPPLGQLLVRQLRTSDDSLGPPMDFSDTAATRPTALQDTGTGVIYGVYRGSSGSPYTVRSDARHLVSVAWITA